MHPKYGSVGHSKTADAATIVEHPVPGCLDTLLKKTILAKAKTDGLAKVFKIRAVFNKVAGPLCKGFEAHSNKKASSTKEPTMTMEQLIQAMNQRKVGKDVIVTPNPAVSGTYVPAVNSNLSQQDIRGAFSAAQGSGSGGSSNTSTAGVCVDYGEFCNLLGLCGYIKYEEIADMTLAQKVMGIIDNYCDEKAVISDCLCPPLLRYDYASSGADKAFLSSGSRSTLRTSSASRCGRWWPLQSSRVATRSSRTSMSIREDGYGRLGAHDAVDRIR